MPEAAGVAAASILAMKACDTGQECADALRLCAACYRYEEKCRQRGVAGVASARSSRRVRYGNRTAAAGVVEWMVTCHACDVAAFTQSLNAAFTDAARAMSPAAITFVKFMSSSVVAAD